MENTPDDRRGQKRPHSPGEPTTPDDSSSAPQSENVLESDSKRDKLLRLLGGKKRKNETAASKWLERVRSREEDIKVSTELESQFNESLSHRLSGASRRHIGIGFKEDPPQIPPSTTTTTTTAEKTQDSVISSLSQRAHVPSLSSRQARPPMPPTGYMNAGPQMYPQNYNVSANLRNVGPPQTNQQMYPQNYNVSSGLRYNRPPNSSRLMNSQTYNVTPNIDYNMPPHKYNQSPGYGNHDIQNTGGNPRYMSYPNQQQNFSGYFPYQNRAHGYPPPPAEQIPKPPPPPPEEPSKAEQPKSKSDFYAQFKKAS